MLSVHHTQTLVDKLEALSRQFDALNEQLADPQVSAVPDRLRELSLKRAALADLVQQYRTYQIQQRDLDEARQIIAEDADPELVALARDQLAQSQHQSEQLIELIAAELVTADDRTVGSVMLEIRAASGGAEAGLWAGDLFQMYQRFAARRQFTETTLNFAPGEHGGLRHVVSQVQGSGVWQVLGYEAGVHCVKRVPQTESQGRIHTSTATVAVLPEPEKVQIELPETDVQIHVTTAQGPGGQNVNKVATAVHIIHLPTGIEVRMQEAKSQHQNRQRAWQLLRARVYDHFQHQKDAQRDKDRKQMLGGGQRSQRIRTYRFKDNLVVDHRLGRSFNLQAVLAGDLDELVDGLIGLDRAQRLSEL